MAKNNNPKRVLPKKRARRARRVRAPMSRISECGRKYAKCVFDPAGSPAKVPDGSAHSVLIEYDLAISGTPDSSGNLTFGALPALPCSALGLLGVFTGPDRNGTNQTVTITSATDNPLFPFKDFSSGVAAAVVGTTIYYNAPLEIQAARMVSLKLEVVPTGALLSQGGSAVTARVPMDYRYHPAQVEIGTSSSGKTFAGASAGPRLCFYEYPPTTFSQLSAFPDAKLCPGTEACVLMTLQSDDDFSPVIPPWSCSTAGSSPALVINGDTATYSHNNFIAYDATNHFAAGGVDNGANFAMIPAATDIALFGNFWHNEHSTMLVWAGQGLPSGQAYSFRVRACMELLVSHATSTYRPFVTPPEADDPLARKAVRDVMAALPSSLPKEGTSPGWWSALGQAASGAATLVAELGLPIVSPAAGVAKRLMNALGI